MQGRRKKICGIMLVFMLIFAWGCGSRNTRSFVREEVDLGYVQRVAVLPFENHSRDEFAHRRARDIAITQVLASGLFDTVDRGQVDSMLREEAIDPGVPIDPHTLRRLGQRLGVQAMVLGSVDQAGEGRAGASSHPEISLTLRLVDSQSGMVLWQASGRGSGYSLSSRLFGTAPKDSFRVTTQLLSELLGTMRAQSARTAATR